MKNLMQIFCLIIFSLFATSCGDCNKIAICTDSDACNSYNSDPCYAYECCNNVNSSEDHQCFWACEEYYNGYSGGSGGYSVPFGWLYNAFCPTTYVEIDSLCRYPEDYGWINCDCQELE